MGCADISSCSLNRKRKEKNSKKKEIEDKIEKQIEDKIEDKIEDTITDKIEDIEEKKEEKIKVKEKTDDNKDNKKIVDKPEENKDDNSTGNKIIFPPNIQEYIIKNSPYQNESNQKQYFKNITIIGDIKEYFPEDITREEIKDIVYNSLNNLLVKDNSEYIKGKNLTIEQVDFIIDILFKKISENIDENQFDIENQIFNDIQVKVGFYDANKENVRNIIFKGRNPTDDEVEETLNKLISENTKILNVELL